MTAVLLTLLVAVVWGVTVIADSAQFSTAITELSPPAYVGTALTTQTCVGFALTMISIWLIPPLVARAGWRWAFATLAIGPALGVLAMGRLRSVPEALKLASGPLAYSAMAAAVLLDLWLLYAFFRTRRSALAAA